LALTELAKRIDHRYTLEIRAGELPAAAEDEDESSGDRATRVAIEVILTKQERLKIAKRARKPILALPRSIANDEDEPKPDE
jgi:hypothetical protein